MRHGRPDIDESTPIPAARFPDWLDAYRQAPLVQEMPPASAIEAARRADLVVCSPLRRSIDSARRLGIERPRILNGFEEMAMPHGALPLLRLSARGWATLFRLLWLGGYAVNASEHRRQGARRAARAAQQLIALAESQGTVLFVGHGIFNRFLARQLRASGWSGPKHPGHGHWSWAEYSPPAK